MAKPHCFEFYCFEQKNKSVIYRQRRSECRETVPLLLKTALTPQRARAVFKS